MKMRSNKKNKYFSVKSLYIQTVSKKLLNLERQVNYSLCLALYRSHILGLPYIRTSVEQTSIVNLYPLLQMRFRCVLLGRHFGNGPVVLLAVCPDSQYIVPNGEVKIQTVILWKRETTGWIIIYQTL